MNINLKKGKTSDISIVLGKHFSENTQSYGKIFEMLVANDFSYSFSDKPEDEYSIQLHLNTLTKADESKAKKASEATTSKKKEKENFDINLLLSKYSFQPQKSTQMPKTKPKTQLTGDYKLKLYLLYVNSSNLQELMTHFERLKTSHRPEVKYIFLLEGIQDFVSGKEMKNKKQKKDFMLSQQTGSQIQLKFGNDGRMCIEEENLPFESREELEEFLVELSLESQLDYKLTSNANETLEFLKSCIGSVIQSKHKSNLGYFDVKSHSHTEVSIYSGKEF